MRDLHFLRTPIRGDHQDRIQNIQISETPLDGNPLPSQVYPQTLEISFDVLPSVTEVQIAPLWEGYLIFRPDSTVGNPIDPSEVIEANVTNWSLKGDLILRSYISFVNESNFENAIKALIPLVTPVPTSVRYSKVEITKDFLFTTLMDVPKYPEFFNEEMVKADDPLYHQKLVINFLKGKAEIPCLLDSIDSSLDTALKPMPIIHLAPPNTPTVLSVTVASLTEKIGDTLWFDHRPEYDDISGELLVDPGLQTIEDLSYNPSHPSHSVISAWSIFLAAKLVTYAPDQDVSRPVRAALTAPRTDGRTFRRIELIRPPIPGSPVGSNPQRPYPMYRLCWKPVQGGATESLRIPLSGRLYLPLTDGQYTFWAIPRSQDPALVTTGDQLKVSLGIQAPAKYIGLPQNTIDVDLTGVEAVTIYSHLQEFDSLFVWEGFRTVVANGTRSKLQAKAKSDWNAEVLDWHILPTNNDSKKSFIPIYGFIRESAARHGLAPEFLLTIAMGEGVNRAIESRTTFDPLEILDAFGFIGLDLILYRTGGTMPDGSAPPIPPEIPATEIDELAEYTFNLVAEGYVDPVTAATVSWIGETPNELFRTIQIAEISGWAAAIELVAAELHARLDEMTNHLSAQFPPTPVVEENQRRFLAYIRFNSTPATSKVHADNMSSELAKWVGANPGNNRNALFNTIQRIAVAQWQEDSKVYR